MFFVLPSCCAFLVLIAAAKSEAVLMVILKFAGCWNRLRIFGVQFRGQHQLMLREKSEKTMRFKRWLRMLMLIYSFPIPRCIWRCASGRNNLADQPTKHHFRDLKLADKWRSHSRMGGVGPKGLSAVPRNVLPKRREDIQVKGQNRKWWQCYLQQRLSFSWGDCIFLDKGSSSTPQVPPPFDSVYFYQFKYFVLISITFWICSFNYGEQE